MSLVLVDLDVGLVTLSTTKSFSEIVKSEFLPQYWVFAVEYSVSNQT